MGRFTWVCSALAINSALCAKPLMRGGVMQII